MICANCQNELKPDAKFCGKCGTPVSIPGHVLACLACGAPMKAGASFCGKCGTPVDSAAAEMTVILPKASAGAAHVVRTPPADAAEEGATVILPKSKSQTTQTAAPQGNVPLLVTGVPEPSMPMEAPARMPPVSMALEFEQQFGSATEIEKRGRTVVAAIFAAAVVLAVIAVAAWWFLTQDGTPPAPVPVAASAPAVQESAPASQVPLSEASPAALEAPPVVASAPVVTEPAVAQPEIAASKPGVKTERKLSEEEEYLRQIRRQLNQQH